MKCKKKALFIALVSVVALVVFVFVVAVYSVPDENVKASSTVPAVVNSNTPQEESAWVPPSVTGAAGGGTPAYVESTIFISFPENWEEENEKKWYTFVESDGYIDAEIIGEIDARTPSAEEAVEVTVRIDKGGRDLVVKGALMKGYDDISVYSDDGILLGSTAFFTPDEEFRVKNVPAGEYRIVVKGLESRNLSCLLKIFTEMTKPEITLPRLWGETYIDISNPYDATLVIAYKGGEVSAPANGNIRLTLPEGDNDVTYWLSDGEEQSVHSDAFVCIDSMPPVVSLTNSFERNGKKIVNMTVNEYVTYIRINGEEILYGDRPNEDGSYPFAHIVNVRTRSIEVEVCDMPGHITKIIIEV